MKLRLLSLSLILCMLIPLVVACKEQNVDGGVTDSKTETETETDTETDTETEGGPTKPNFGGIGEF